MPPIPASGPQRRGRRKASIAMLLALFALAAGAQALAPTSASAVINQLTAGGCTVIVDVATGKIEGRASDGTACALTDAQLIAAASGGGFPGDVYPVSGTAPTTPKPPRSPTFNPCPIRALCMPQGGGTKGSRPDGDVLHDRKTPPSKPGTGKGEVKKSKSKPKAKPKKDGDNIGCQAVEDRLIKNKNEVIRIGNVGTPKVGGSFASIDIDKVPPEKLEPQGRDYWRQEQQRMLKLKSDVERDEKRMGNPGCKEN